MSSESSHLSPLIASVSLPALAQNLAEIHHVLSKGCEILAIVKADAYGHGLSVISRTLAQLAIRRLGVATVQEGIALREIGFRGSIVVMGGLFSDHLRDLIQHDLTPVISDEETACKLTALLQSRPTPYPVHIKVDTGMSRLGFSTDVVVSLLQSPPFKGPLRVDGLMTHLADADNPEPNFTQHQIKQFQEMIDQVQSAGITIPLRHAANSAAILLHPTAHFGLVRPGILLYGYAPKAGQDSVPHLRPIMRLTTKVIQIRTVSAGESVSYNRTYTAARPSRIAVLPIGYAHGYTRRLSNCGAVLIGGHRAPIVGRICMDMTLVDITTLPWVNREDEVVLIGKQGSDEITATDVADWQGTIPYEVLCSMGPRAHRVYEPLTGQP